MNKHTTDKNPFNSDKFQIVSVSVFLERPDIIRDSLGVYAIFLRGLATELTNLECQDLKSGLWNINCYQHAYTGESVGIRTRLNHHISGSIFESDFRRSVIALHLSHGLFWKRTTDSIAQIELELDAFITANGIIAFKHCRYVRDVERSILSISASPLNMRDRKSPGPINAPLKTARSALSAHVRKSGHKKSPTPASKAGWFSIPTRLRQRPVNHTPIHV